MKRTTAKRRVWNAWSGDVTALRALGRVVEAAINDRRGDLPGEYERYFADIREGDAGKTGSIGAAALLWLGARDLDLGEEDWGQLEVTVLDGSDEISGGMDDVFAELDRRSVQKVTFAAKFHDGLSRLTSVNVDELVVTLAKPLSRADEPGVTIHVSSGAIGWARSAFASISEEIDKGTPKWAFIRGSNSVQWMPSVALALIAGAVMLALKVDVFLFIALFVLAFISPLAFGTLVHFGRAIDWVFPRFEIVGEGAQSTGWRRIAAVSSVLIRQSRHVV